MSPVLRLVGSPAPSEVRPGPLFDLVALEPVLVTEDDVDVISLINEEVSVLDLSEDVSRASAAQLALDWFLEYEGSHARTDGDRAMSLDSHLQRYVLPHLLEVALAAPADARTVEDLTFAQSQQLAMVLAGKRPLPAATVVGDLLKRSAVTCIWLTIDEAARVSHGGLKAVARARAEGRIVARKGDGGRLLVLSAELRSAGLLAEPDGPHGMLQPSAKNVLFVLKQAMLRAQDHGAAVRGNYTHLVAIKPTDLQLARARRVDSGYIALGAARAVAAHLSVVHQLTLWLLRLTGMRIGEAFGLLVGD